MVFISKNGILMFLISKNRITFNHSINVYCAPTLCQPCARQRDTQVDKTEVVPALMKVAYKYYFVTCPFSECVQHFSSHNVYFYNTNLFVVQDITK